MTCARSRTQNNWPSRSTQRSAVLLQSARHSSHSIQHAQPLSSTEPAAISVRTTRLAAAPSRESQAAPERQSGQASTSGREFNSMVSRRSQEKQAEQSVADKLIAVFASKTPAEWRKLIAFSRQWPTLADRCSTVLSPCRLDGSHPVTPLLTARHIKDVCISSHWECIILNAKGGHENASPTLRGAPLHTEQSCLVTDGSHF